MEILYAPCKNKQEATTIAKTLLREKLVACANLIESTSLYSWKGKLKEEKEVIVIAKTKQAKKAEQRILSLHSYKVPCVLTVSAKANVAFEKWVNDHDTSM
ncbi:divalent-cation tolerance protein CutA [Candidatus Woesearchaeota archaeon]|nr:divalent-cation tolerance protein CutA [Candidatus Woesearchaeota archaeon]